MTLLTQNYQKEFRKEKIQKLGLAFAVLFGTAVLIGTVLMLPTYFLLAFSKNEVLRLRKASEEVFVRKEYKSLEDKISHVNSLIKAYEENEKRRYPLSPLLTKLISGTSQGIATKNLNLKRGDAGSFILRVDGKADTRDSLLSYVAKLEKITEFEAVRSPITNLLKEKEADFILEIKIKQDFYKYAK